MCDDATIRDLIVRTNTEWFQRYAGPPMSQGLIDELSARLLCWHIKQINNPPQTPDPIAMSELFHAYMKAITDTTEMVLNALERIEKRADETPRT